MAHTYKFPRPMVAVDCVVFGYNDRALQVLLIERGGHPYKGEWALPGGIVRIKESLEDAARRELMEETALHDVYLEQLFTFGEVDRDTRGRVISVAYYALVRSQNHEPHAASDAAKAEWFDIDKLPVLAFDHAEILDVGLKRLRAKVRYEPLGFSLLPPKFPLLDLEKLYEAALGREVDRRNFRKKILGMGILRDAGVQEGVPHRPARLYSFDETRYHGLVRQGFNFEV